VACLESFGRRGKRALPSRLSMSIFVQPITISRYLPDVQPMATADAGGNGKRNPVAGHSESPHARHLSKGGRIMWKSIAPVATGICWFLAVAALALSVASAEATNKKDRDAVVREIDLTGFTRASTRGVASKPTRITNAEELAKAFPDTDEEWLDRIARQVDFEKDELLFFAWIGSSTDRLTSKVEQTRKGPVVIIRYEKGRGEDMPRPQFGLYAIAKNWRVKSTK
jgi:hypothetical protein